MDETITSLLEITHISEMSYKLCIRPYTSSLIKVH